MELSALAFACDITRVGGMQWISHNTVFNWLGATQQHHPLSHSHGSAGVDAQLTKIVAWHAEQAAAFLTQLKSFQEGEGTVFDNTVFIWTNEQSVGSHKFDRGPILIAAGKFPLATGGTLQTGRYVKVAGRHPAHQHPAGHHHGGGQRQDAGVRRLGQRTAGRPDVQCLGADPGVSAREQQRLDQGQHPAPGVPDPGLAQPGALDRWRRGRPGPASPAAGRGRR